MPLYKTMLKYERRICMKMKTALTIAGSDCSGGAGIQADLKTMTMNGVYAMSAIQDTFSNQLIEFVRQWSIV